MAQRIIVSPSIWATRRGRLAPSAVRTASSRWRSTPRARMRFARLAQPMSRMAPTAPRRAPGHGAHAAVDDHVAERHRANAPASVRVGMQLGQPRGDEVELVLGLLAGAVGSEQAEAGDEALGAAGSPRRIGGRAIGHPQVVALRETDAHGHHAHDREGTAVQDDTLAHDAGIASEPSLVETVAQEDHRCVSEVLSLFIAEVAAQRRDAGRAMERGWA